MLPNSNEIIKVEETDNFAKIEILKNCSLFYFYNELLNKLSTDKFINININSIFKGEDISKKIIYLIKKENSFYNIIINKKINNNNKKYNKNMYKDIIILEKTNTNDETIETQINLLKDKNYMIKTITSTTSGITKSINIYEKLNTLKINTNQKLRKKDALQKTQEILDNLSKIENINDIISTEEIANYLNIVLSKDIHPIINDDIIILSLNKNSTEKETIFDIILKTTKERIGYIKLTNKVEHKIFKEYRNENFEKRSLMLLSEYVQNKNVKDNKVLIKTS